MLISDNIKIYFYTEPVDMRKSIDSLCILISDILNMNPADGCLYLFRSKSANKLKALYYEANCFTLWYRRLEKGRFVFPRDEHGNIEMSHDHFNWLLASDKYLLMKTREPTQISQFI